MMVYFIGAGPGNPNLLTLQADQILKTCKTIIYAGSLIPKTLLENYQHAKWIDSAPLTLEDIGILFESAKKKNENIARLHSGDLSIYSAMGEQINLLENQNIAYQVIPGISAFSAFSALLGEELTQPNITQSLILTRFSKNTPIPEQEKLEALAKHQASLMIHLGILHTKKITNVLATYYGDDHPVAVGYKITQPEQDYLISTLKKMPELVKIKKWQKTALIFISPVLKSQNQKKTRSNLYDPNFSHLYRH